MHLGLRTVSIATLIGCCVAAACSSFGEDGQAVPSDGGADAGSDGTADGPAPCEPEPEWAVPDGGVTTATCAGQANTDLLASREHCGRCDHSCGTDSCIGGLCALRLLDERSSYFVAADNGALYYYYLLDSDNSVWRSTAQGPRERVTATPDAGGDAAAVNETPQAATLDDGVLWLRTNDAIYRVLVNVALPTVAERFVSVSTRFTSQMVSIGSRLYLTHTADDQIIWLDKNETGEVHIAASPAPGAYEAKRRGDRLVWLEQEWRFYPGAPAPSTMREVDRAGNVFPLLSGAGDLAGLAVDGEEAFVMRRGDAGAVLHIDIASGAVTPIFERAFEDDNGYSMAVTVDPTHIYWILPSSTNPDNGDVYKRARCGGASVRIARDIVRPRKLSVIGDRLFIHAENAINTIAK